MKRGLKALLSAGVLAAITISMLAGLTRLTERKDSSYTRNEQFYRQGEDFDVLFYGTSHVLCGIYPMELWQDYGIASYNYGTNGSFMPEIYWTIVNSLDYATPKLVVIDCFRFCNDVKTNSGNPRQAHEYFDSLPMSLNKIRAAWDIFTKEDNRLEFLWNFIVYHDRWTELAENDFVPSVWLTKGGQFYTGLAQPKQFPSAGQEKLTGEPLGLRYLRKAIELCQSRGIEVLLTYLPFPANEEHQKEANRACDIAEEYGVGYIDFLHMDQLVDMRTDCLDFTEDGENGHVNVSGAWKVTDYLGEYISERYDIPDRREDPAYKDWDDDYREYMNYKVDQLARQTDVRNCLLLLWDKHMSSVLYLAPSDLWHGDSIYEDLLENIGVDVGKLHEDVPTLVVVDNVSGEAAYLAPGDEADTFFGQLTFRQTDGAYEVAVDGETELELKGSTIAAMTVDNTTGKVLNRAQFTASTSTSTSFAKAE